MYEVSADRLVAGDTCEIAKKAWNSAHLFKNLFTTLVLVLGVVLVAATVYTFLAFRDDQTARGFLALTTAVVSGGGFAAVLKMRGDARKDENEMFKRVRLACKDKDPAVT